MKSNKFVDSSVPLITPAAQPEQELKSNITLIRIATAEERIAAAQPTHPVRKTDKGLIEEIDGIVVISRSTRSAVSVIRRFWVLRTVRPWYCGLLGKMIEAGRMIHCYDDVDLNALSCMSADGPLCTIIEEVHL